MGDAASSDEEGPKIHDRPIPFVPGPERIPARRHEDGYGYELIVEQQPIRARMCGYGDKDRRPITPPPVVRLRITDLKTGLEIVYKAEGLDLSRLIVAADLYDEPGTEARSVVKSPPHYDTTKPDAINTSSLGPFPPNVYPQHSAPYAHPMVMGQHPAMPMGHAAMNGSYMNNHQPVNGHGYTLPVVSPPNGHPVEHSGEIHSPIAIQKNLIGQCHASFCVMVDPDGRMGCFAVFPDLSIRTEARYRLKFDCYKLGAIGLRDEPKTDGNELFKKAPSVHTAFSRNFKVYSAKKFPGVIESTRWSKCLAGQGVKIPIRNAKKGKDGKEETKDDGKGMKRSASGDPGEDDDLDLDENDE
jgi:hypothetical protein